MARPDITSDEADNVRVALSRSQLSAGHYVEQASAALAKALGRRFAVLTSSGTSALECALRAVPRVQGANKAIMPALTFAGTAYAARSAGLKPVFVDVERDTWCMDPKLVEQRMDDHTCALVPVHLYGRYCSWPRPPVWTYVVEDAAESLWPHPAGQGHLTCTSFYGNKILTCGEGGAVASSVQWLFARAKNETGYATRHMTGANHRMGELQAAVLMAQITRLERMMVQRRAAFAAYLELINPELYELPPPQTVPWLMPVVAKSYEHRERARRHLEQLRIETRDFFHPLSRKDTPVACELYDRGIVLPLTSRVQHFEIERIAEGLNSIEP